MKKVIISLLAAVAALVLSTSTSLAAVTFDSETGEGFVGKGDVQQVFGWNNAQLQNNAGSVEFRYSEVETVSWTCEWTTGPAHNQTVHTQVRTMTAGIEGDIAKDTRKNKQGMVTGFLLTGYDGNVTTGTSGPPYHSCPNNAVVVGDDVVESLGGGLEVSNDGSNWQPLN